MPTRKYYLFANWKMYLDYDESLALASEIATKLAVVPDSVVAAVFPSALSFVGVEKVLSATQVNVGAQNAHWVDKGGYTGEISPEMYRRVGATYALVGHSERRHLAGETNHDVRQKIEALLQAGVTPVVCVGETALERSAGQATEVVEAQLRSAFAELSWPANQPVIIAYEPVWAIGTGEACAAPAAEEMHALIAAFTRALVPTPPISILYGGSVRTDNVQSYLREEHIDGVLVGGASIKTDTWFPIVDEVCKLL